MVILCKVCNIRRSVQNCEWLTSGAFWLCAASLVGLVLWSALCVFGSCGAFLGHCVRSWLALRGCAVVLSLSLCRGSLYFRLCCAFVLWLGCLMGYALKCDYRRF